MKDSEHSDQNMMRQNEIITIIVNTKDNNKK